MGDSNFSRGFEEILDNTESEIGDAIHQAMDLMAGVLREEGLQFGAEADHVRVVPELEEAFRDRPYIASSIMVSWFWVVQINESENILAAQKTPVLRGDCHYCLALLCSQIKKTTA